MSEHPSPLVRDVSNEIADYADMILEKFKPGSKITLLVRCPGAPDHSRDFVLTNDALDEAIAALTRRKDPNGTVNADV